MPTFAFRARDKQGQVIQGIREAPDRDGALTALREAGFFVTQLAPAPNKIASDRAKNAVAAAPPIARTPIARPDAPPGAANANGSESHEDGSDTAPPSTAGTRSATPPRAAIGQTTPNTKIDYTARASNKDIALYFGQMNSMLHAGTSLSHALGAMGEYGTNGGLRRASRDMSARVLQGETWSETMRSYPGLFSGLVIGIIAAGEQGGFLDRMCLRLAVYAERDYEIEQTIKRETWYPKLLILCSIVIPTVPILFLQGFGPWVRAVLPPLILLGLVWVGWKVFKWATPLVKGLSLIQQGLDGAKLLVPVASKVVRSLATAKFCRALGTLYSAGIGPHRAVDMAASACGNEAMANGARRIIPRLERGDSLSDALASTGYFPSIALMMLRTGEQTGAVDTQLDKLADFLEADAETAIKQSVKVLGILVFFFVAWRIAMQVIAFYQQYGGEATQIMDDIDKT